MTKSLQRYLLYLSLSLFVMGFIGCDLSGPPQSALSEGEIFGNSRLVEVYMDDLHKAMGHGLHEIMVASLTDESHFIHGYGTREAINIQIIPSYLGVWQDDRFDDYQWGELYSFVARVNRFFENIDDSAIQDPALIDQMKGEAHFIRAFIYHKLLKVYGGVPIIVRSFEVDDDLQVPRNTFAETARFILDELEQASDLLTLQAREQGYASRGAAMALKSRVLLFLASDLYHVNPASEFVGYGSSERQEFWEEARDAAREVIDLGIYELFNRHSDPVENFTQLFLANEDHEEAIMSRFFPPNIQDDGYHPGLHNGPNGYLNWGGNTPVLSLVNAFEMEDGSDFDWDKPSHAASPFENRDPRFYATILYTGSNTPGPQDDEFYTGRRLDGTWSWTDRGYFLPIPHDELSRNERLVQNPGY